jgi:glycerol-3-phosphate dehydrogenase
VVALQLSPAYRRAALARLREQRFDIVVVGGGVVGCGAALDAATRGLNVALIEASDYAAGSSSRSSKLLHGGLRYLRQGRVDLVREALRERALLIDRLCPHLARTVPLLLPLERHGLDRGYVGAGVALYELLGGDRKLPRHRHLTRRTTLRLAPALRPDRVSGAVLLHDGQVDDARHTVTLARTAAHYEATVISSARGESLIGTGERVVGVRVRDMETGELFEVHGDVVLSATGVWTEELQEMAGARRPFSIRASKGVHLVVPRDRIGIDTGLLLQTENSVLFVIPWDRHWLIGTTDTPWGLDLVHPAASRSDIEYLLEQVNRVLSTPLDHDDIVGVYVGLRPLLGADERGTSALSREHAVRTVAPGLVAVAGGKYTTYRVMARDAVDSAAGMLAGPVAESCTQEVPLLGADGWRAMYNARQRLAQRSGLNVEIVERLLGRFGTETVDILGLIAAEPELARRIPGADAYLAAEVRWAVQAEGALHLDDVLTRRTRISIETVDRGIAASAAIAELIAPALGWSHETVHRETAAYRERVAAERQSQQQPTDEQADLARLAAADLRRTNINQPQPAEIAPPSRTRDGVM